MTDPCWYAVQTHVHAEAKAAWHLVRQGYSIYLPRYLKRRRHARRIDTVAAPLFPRYLFITIDRVAQRWRSIQSTIGVAHLVCNGEEPAMVPTAVITDLQGREDERGLIQLETRPRFVPGDKIQVVDGPFDACLGLFEGMADRERVAILLDLLGRKVRVVLDGASVAAAHGPWGRVNRPIGTDLGERQFTRSAVAFLQCDRANPSSGRSTASPHEVPTHSCVIPGGSRSTGADQIPSC